MTVILALVAWLVTYLLHSTVLLAGAFLLASIGIVRSHAGRDTLWKVALVGGIVTASAQLAFRLQPAVGHVAIAARPQSALVDVAGVRPATVQVSGVDRHFAVSRPNMRTMAPAPTRRARSLVQGLNVSWPAMLLNIWFLGALALGAQLLWMRMSLSRRLKERVPVSDGPLADALADLCRDSGCRVPRLSISESVSGPIAFGREICLPARVSTSLSLDEQRAVLAHELGHLMRRDPAWLVAAALIETILFIQPLNRLARRRLRIEAEFLCDDWAAERTGGITLARCLAEVAGWMKGETAAMPVASMAGNCSQLVSRVERLIQGTSGARPARWIVRAGLGAGAMILVACSVPGVAAEAVGNASPGLKDRMLDKDAEMATSVMEASYVGEGWGEIHDHAIELAAGYTVRISGHGHIGFRRWGRAIVVPDEYEISVGGHEVQDDYVLADSTRSITVTSEDGAAWEIVPVRVSGTAMQSARREWSRELARRSLEDPPPPPDTWLADADADIDAAQARASEDSDAAIDSLVQRWVRDPEAVQRAARRIARTYDHDLRPQFESLGVQLGHEMTPQLERLTARAGHDLGPDFARLGAALGASILSELSADVEAGAGAGDYYRRKGDPKKR